jgi:hypothetical protein
MSLDNHCPYCGVRLATGKHGNSGICLLCQRRVCEKCLESGICSVHFQKMTPDQANLIKKTNRNYNFSIFGSVFGLIGIFALSASLILPVLDQNFNTSSIILLIASLIIMVGIVWLITKIQAIFIEKMNKIYPNTEDY